MVANGDLSLSAGGRLALSESGAGGRADLTARGGTLFMGHPFVAGGTVQLAGRDGVGAGVVQSGGDLGIVSSGGAVTTGALFASGAVAVSAAQGLHVAGPVAAGEGVHLRSGSALQVAGSVVAGADLSLGGASVRVGEVLAAGQLVVEAGQIEADSLGAGGALALSALTGVSVTGGVLSNGPLSIAVREGAMTVGGALASNEALAAMAQGDIRVLGGVGSGAAASLLSSQGRIAVQGGASAAAGLTLDASGPLDVGGELAARGPIVLRSGTAGRVLEVGPQPAHQALRFFGGAGFDVASIEPPPPDHPLMQALRYPNFILTPHVAWASDEAVQALADQLVDNVEAFVRGVPRHIVGV